MGFSEVRESVFGWRAPVRCVVGFRVRVMYSGRSRRMERVRVGCQHAPNRIKCRRAMEGVGVSEKQDNPAADHISISESGSLADSRAITKLPVQDLDRARAFY